MAGKPRAATNEGTGAAPLLAPHPSGNLTTQLPNVAAITPAPAALFTVTCDSLAKRRVCDDSAGGAYLARTFLFELANQKCQDFCESVAGTKCCQFEKSTSFCYAYGVSSSHSGGGINSQRSGACVAEATAPAETITALPTTGGPTPTPTPAQGPEGASVQFVHIDGQARSYEIRDDFLLRAISVEDSGVITPLTSNHRSEPLIAAPGEYYPSTASTPQACANDCDSLSGALGRTHENDGFSCYGFSFKFTSEKDQCVLHSICSMDAFGFQYIPFDVTRYCDHPVTSCYCRIVYGDPGVARRGRRFLRGAACPGK